MLRAVYPIIHSKIIELYLNSSAEEENIVRYLWFLLMLIEAKMKPWYNWFTIL